MKHILVTGAAGFIGSEVVKKLLGNGLKVLGVDNMNDYYDVRVKEWRLNQFIDHDHFKFQKLDIGDKKLVNTLFKEYKFDAVINLAARAGVRASVLDPWVYYQTNVTGTLNLLENCRHSGVKKFVLASTSSVYGESQTPFPVDGNTNMPLSPYAASKKAAETLCYSYHYLYDIDVSIPRYFTVYGPAGRPDMSYFKFMLRIDRGLPIDIYGDGEQSRDFTFVGDVAEATVRALELSGYNIFNVGNDRPIKLLEMINILEKLMGKTAQKNYIARHPADNPITWADLSTTVKLLNWRPQVPLEEGLKMVCEWFNENRSWLSTINLTD